MKRLSMLAVLALGVALAMGCGQKKDEGAGKAGEVGTKVKLDFHIMSKCPFGVKVLEAIIPVLEKMGPNVDFNVYYIGKEQNGEFTSMHGEQEVKGNILQLCARDVGDFDGWLAFVKCQIQDWRKIPDGWEDCAKKAKLDAGKMKSCYEGDQGKTLLRASFKASEDKKATGSPTIFLGGEKEPYRGGRSEASFGRAICAKFDKEKPAYCKDIPAPVKVPVTVIGDKRCTERTCDTKRFVAFISHTFEGAEIRELDYADGEGKAMFEKTKEKFLPVAIFGPEVEKEEQGYARLKRRLTKLEGSDNFVFPLGRTWDPKAEICNDGVDNTGDGKVDCDDDTCKGKKECREEMKNKVDLFVMSQCPYGVRTVNAMEEVIKNFKNDRKKMDFTLEFIGNMGPDGKPTSMHGQGEIDEDLRQVCAQKYYGKDYKFMGYILCRNKDVRSTDWQACATGGVKADVVKKCAEGPEGLELLKASFKKAEDLGISGSPSWLLNNKFEMAGRDPEGIKAAFCGKNTGTAGCETTLSAGNPETTAPAGGCGPTGPAPAPTPAVAPPPGAPIAPAMAPAAAPKPIPAPAARQ
ncbi:MAG: GILT family protein [Deltaproteobacteria bacterium]|nr:GILT family protein [Deltaproteobacteria bacterium]